jgi:hypothetical protein
MGFAPKSSTIPAQRFRKVLASHHTSRLKRIATTGSPAVPLRKIQIFA